MTHHEDDSRTLGRALEILTENGMDGMARALEIVFNAAMKLEREQFLGAGPFERSANRIGHANGFKPRRLQSRVGALDLAIPQVRGLEDTGPPGPAESRPLFSAGRLGLHDEQQHGRRARLHRSNPRERRELRLASPDAQLARDAASMGEPRDG